VLYINNFYKILINHNYCHIKIYNNEEENYKIVACEYMENPPKGVPKQKKKKATNSSSNRRKSFYNQATIIMDYQKPINLKIFRNGSVHITGVLNQEHGKQSV
jgi:hypothetical protein